MKHKEFGKLVAILRQDLGMTQFQLAEKSELAVAVVSQIERGVKRYFDADLLQKMAAALELNLHERQQFYAAAVGLDDSIPLMADDNAPEVKQANRTFDQMLALLERIRVPGHIVDVYGDVVAANMIIVGLYQVTPDTIVESQAIPAGFSSLRLLFGGVLQSVFSEGYDLYLLNSMRSFREFSLRYRALPYAVQVMNELRNPKKYPAFERYWRKAALMDDDKAVNLDVFEYSHVHFGTLHYSAVFTVSSTPFGELMLIYNLPMDKHTTDVFEQLADTVGTSAFRFAPWPIKPV
jgi:transcriptional regulator with XRE-family HTH domain